MLKREGLSKGGELFNICWGVYNKKMRRASCSP